MNHIFVKCILRFKILYHDFRKEIAFARQDCFKALSVFLVVSYHHFTPLIRRHSHGRHVSKRYIRSTRRNLL